MNKSAPAFNKLHEEFRPKIHRYLVRLVGEDDAEDLTQEVFIKVSQGLKDFRGESQLSTWIYRIATNTAIDRLRSPSFKQRLDKISPQQTLAEDGEEVGEKDMWSDEKPPSVEQVLIRQEMWECLREFVQQLPVSYRAAVILSDLEGMKDREIANVLGLSLESVKIRLHRGRTKLRKEFEAHCGMYRDARNQLLWSGKRP